MNKQLTGLQVKLSRISLKWTVDDLSQKSGISWSIIQNIESKEDYIDKKPELKSKLLNVFKKEGINMFDEDEEFKPYIKLKK